MLSPLLYAALDNALRLGDAGLTGPVARGDAGTVAGHLAALRQTAPEALPVYVALARLTADRALAAGLLAPPTPNGCSTCWPGRTGDRPIGYAGPTAAGSAWSPPGPNWPPRGPGSARRSCSCPPWAPCIPVTGVCCAMRPKLPGQSGSVVVSIFVNPRQFGPGRGPRPLPAHARRRPGPVR